MKQEKQNGRAAVILAAGMGKRMKSDLPKVLHQLNGKYLVDYVIESVRKAGIENIILVIGHKHELVREKLADRKVKFVIQQPQLGTGHAVQTALPALDGFSGELLVLCGDMPLISPDTITGLVQLRQQTNAAAAVLTVKLDDPAKYGRIVRSSNGLLEAIIEYRDADEQVRRINEVNTGAYCFAFSELAPVLKNLKAENAQSEYYLTDTICLFRENGLKVAAFVSDNPREGLGINSREELTELEKMITEQKPQIQGKIINKD